MCILIAECCRPGQSGGHQWSLALLQARDGQRQVSLVWPSQLWRIFGRHPSRVSDNGSCTQWVWGRRICIWTPAASAEISCVCTPMRLPTTGCTGVHYIIAPAPLFFSPYNLLLVLIQTFQRFHPIFSPSCRSSEDRSAFLLGETSVRVA